jgi:hypothetical protein
MRIQVDRRAEHGRTARAVRLLIALFALLVGASAATAEDHEAAETKGATGFWEALASGTPTLNLRARVELANQDTFEASQAYTIRTRLGYGSMPWHGISAYADFENTAAIAQSQYYDGVEPATGQTIIADPTMTELNQAYLKIKRDDFLDTTVIGGRQLILLDNVRFVGNVAFRQNEQTYDAGYVDSSLGIDGLKLRYGYIGRVHRIWSGQGEDNVSRYDWASNSHIVNASYQLMPEIRLAVFTYLFEFDDDGASPGTVLNSSASYGARLSGAYLLGERWELGYDVNYAYQTEYKNNPLDYSAHYALVDTHLNRDGIGSLGFGYERLGSDDGMARFVTPLATAHKYNGWADIFLDNGAANGLQDIYVSLSPRMPWKLQLKAIYHHFRAAEGGDALGDEIDVDLKRPINDYLTAMVTAAYFDARDGATKTRVVDPATPTPAATPIQDIYRVWFTLEFKF